MTTVDVVLKFLHSEEWTPAERGVIAWQFDRDMGLLGGFERALWCAIETADEGNLARLKLGFPEQVEGYLMWTHGDLGTRLRAAGLGI